MPFALDRHCEGRRPVAIRSPCPRRGGFQTRPSLPRYLIIYFFGCPPRAKTAVFGALWEEKFLRGIFDEQKEYVSAGKHTLFAFCETFEMG